MAWLPARVPTCTGSHHVVRYSASPQPGLRTPSAPPCLPSTPTPSTHTAPPPQITSRYGTEANKAAVDFSVYGPDGKQVHHEEGVSETEIAGALEGCTGSSSRMDGAACSPADGWAAACGLGSSLCAHLPASGAPQGLKGGLAGR